MEPLSLTEIATAVKGQLKNKKEIMIDSISTDTRTLEPGELFFALIGDNFDGHQFVESAFEQGAKAAVVDRDLELDQPLIIVDDTTKALQRLAHYYRSKFSLPVIAVTGSTGKTTTKDMIASVLSEEYKTLKSKENFNNQIGLPKTLFNLDSSYEALVVEMGMRGLGEIRTLAQIAEPDIGVVTNVGVTHIELLGSQEKIAQAKAELVEELPRDGVAVLNGDDKRVKQMKELTSGQVIYYGLESDNQIKGEKINNLGETGVEFQIVGADWPAVKLSIPGEYNVYNALAAAAVGHLLEVSKAKIKTGLENLKLSKYRSQLIETKTGVKIINDAYNANPTSMQAALDTLSEINGNRKIAVLGDMLELGSIAKSEHHKLGKLVVEQEIDYLLTVGDLGTEIASGAKEAGMSDQKVFTFNDNQAAGKKLLELTTEDDIILVKASRGMQLEGIVNCFQNRE